MDPLYLISAGVLSLYIWQIIKYWCAWEHYPELKNDSETCDIKLSVLVAFRNEYNNLPNLLQGLKEQKYPSDHFEVILINDHSNDGSEQYAEEWCVQHENFRCIHSGMGDEGKKAALYLGTGASAYDYIVTTDADCVVTENWLAGFSRAFQVEKADFIVGVVIPAITEKDSISFQVAEYCSLAASGASSAAAGNALFCSGANMGFRKGLFYQFMDPMNGQFASGDDTFFLHRVKQNVSHRIVLLKSSLDYVKTVLPNTLPDFLRQRRRWVSKGRAYKDLSVINTSLLVILTNATLLASFLATLWGMNAWLFCLMMSCKTATDYLLLRSFMKYYKIYLPLGRFIIFEFIYPLYLAVVLVAAAGIGFQWKGRYYKS